MLNGNVIPSAIRIYNPGSALGAANLIAAGTAIYEALAPKMEKMNLLPTLCKKKPLIHATKHPFISGITKPKIIGNAALLLKVENLLAVINPISSKKMARNPLNISVVKGLMPSACLESEMNPIIRLPKIINTLLLVNECLKMCPKDVLLSDDVSNFFIKITPIIMAGASINAITATM